ncbi:DUF2232 domain-containing protein [Hyphomicrobium sp. CS1GBMeth3]|uniref:DUF2232 domain-containing protein n=1 Tax=Hyphomicrobium sp. CS1GBMeth3 TaxID=1892845 RepID=UPI0009302C4C|nr:DUF2232 domain-containing protein [Hyphomicrobium sp. CS1GBMeth3]
MRAPLLAGIGLGLVAAVVFASATTGSLLVRFILMFITPMPIALAGLGWGWRSAVVAVAAGAGLILVLTSPLVAVAFAVTQGVPMAVLTYLALLSRPLSESDTSSPNAQPASLEWYPPGRLVIWAAVMSGLIAVAMLLMMAGDMETLRKSLADFMKAAIESGLPRPEGAPALSDAELAALSEVTLSVLPAAFATSWMGSLLFNLWVSGRVTLASGQLGRPWPDLAALTYPTGTALGFGIMLVATMLTGYAGVAASAFAGGFFVAYVLLGLAVIHYTTRGQPWRLFALWALYGFLLVGNVWAAIVVAMLGLAEAILQLRARMPAPPAPPAQPNS